MGTCYRLRVGVPDDVKLNFECGPAACQRSWWSTGMCRIWNDRLTFDLLHCQRHVASGSEDIPTIVMVILHFTTVIPRSIAADGIIDVLY